MKKYAEINGLVVKAVQEYADKHYKGNWTRANEHLLREALKFEALEKEVERLRLMLIRVRGVLAAQEDKSCLGTGEAEDCAPWPIVEEIIYGISIALDQTR